MSTNYLVDVLFVPSSSTTVAVNAARAHTAKASPRMIVYVNGTQVGQVYVTNTSQKDFSFNTSLASSQIRNVTVQFANANNGVDLFVKSVRLGTATPILSSSSAVIYDRGALDNKDTLMGSNGNMYWNGYLIFNIPAQ